MRSIGIIPARFGSTRFPGKLLAPIKGKTLIQRTFENAKKCTKLEKLVIATDHEEIYEHVKGFGAEVYMTSANCLNGTERIAELLERESSLREYDIIVNVQGDEPCVAPELIQGLIDTLEAHPQASVCTPVALLDPNEAHNRSSVKCVRDLKGKALYFSRSLLPGGLKGEIRASTAYYKHIGLYAYRGDFLAIYKSLPSTPLQQAEDLEQLKILEHGFEVQTFIADYHSADVNHPEDILKVEELIT